MSAAARNRLLAKRPQACSHLLHEKVGLFPSGEVSAFRDFIEMNEIAVGPLRPASRTLVNFLRKDADSRRNGDAKVLKEAFLELGIQTGRGHPGVRQPRQRNVIEDVVASKI